MAELVRFNTLPKQTRERLLAATRGEGNAAAIHSELAAPAKHAWSGLLWGLGTLLLLAWVAVASLGESVDGGAYLIAYVGFAIIGLGGVLGALGLAQARKRRLIPDGTYVLPVDVVVVRDGLLGLYSMAKLANVEARDLYAAGTYRRTLLRLSFQDGVITLTVRGQDRARKLLEDLNHGQRINAAAFEAEDMELFERRDPFYIARTSKRWVDFLYPDPTMPEAKDEPRFRAVALPLRKPWLSATLLGAALGVGLWQGRNVLSDERMFAAAQEFPTVGGHQHYLREGGTRHAEQIQRELDETLIPKARLDAALDKHTVTALRQYRENYPDGPFDEEAKAGIHALFEAAKDDFRRQSATLNPDVVEAIVALLDHVERRGAPWVPIRFQRPDPEALEAVDVVVSELTPKDFEGLRIVPISPSFTDERSVARESWITIYLEKGFREIFPADILSLRIGERFLSEVDFNTLELREPTFIVSYAISASGSIYREVDQPQDALGLQPPKDPRIREPGYVGIKVAFRVTLMFPEGQDGETPKPLSFMLMVQPPPTFDAPADTGISVEASDYEIYDIMARVAFEELATQLGRALFGGGESEGLEVVAGEIPELGFPEMDGEEGEG